MKKRRLLIIYLVLLHAALAVLLIKPDITDRIQSYFSGSPDAELDFYVNTMATFQLRAEANLDTKPVLIFGDSHVQGLCTLCINSGSINYGIGTDTADELLQRIHRYHSVQLARAVVFSIGYNDLKKSSVADTAQRYK